MDLPVQFPCMSNWLPAKLPTWHNICSACQRLWPSMCQNNECNSNNWPFWPRDELRTMHKRRDRKNRCRQPSQAVGYGQPSSQTRPWQQAVTMRGRKGNMGTAKQPAMQLCTGNLICTSPHAQPVPCSYKDSLPFTCQLYTQHTSEHPANHVAFLCCRGTHSH